MSTKIHPDLCTSIDDLRSSLQCSYDEPTAPNIAYLRELLAGCPPSKKTMHALLTAWLAKLEKRSPRPSASADGSSGPDHSGSALGKLLPYGGMLEGRDAAGAIAATTTEPEDEDELLGLQLSMQWEKAVGGQRDQILFGAMMMKLKARLSARGQPKKGGHDLKKGEGLQGWLEDHAPKVSRGTAYRLMEIAEGVQAICKLGKKIDLEELLACSGEDVPEQLQKKRAEIEKLIAGKSQRQLLLEFGGKEDGRSNNKPGFRPNALYLRAWLEQEYPDNPEYLGVDVFTDLPKEVQKRFKTEGKRYEERLTKEQREEIETAADARAWNEQITPAITLGIDKEYYLRATDEQRAALLTALTDLRELLNQAEANRAGKRNTKALAAK